MFRYVAMPGPELRKKTWFHFCWYHLPVILYAGVVITISSIPDLRTPAIRQFAFDKLAHLMEYAIFAAITIRSFSNAPGLIPARRAFIVSVLFLALFAVFDETYQHFIPGRFSSATDALADIVGALLVLAFFEVRRRRLARVRKKA